MKPGKLLSSRVKELREAAGLSQQELATLARLSVSQVAKLEQGAKADPRISTILSLAAALQVKPGQILDDLPWPASEKKGGKGKKKDRKEGKEKKIREKKPRGKTEKGKGKKQAGKEAIHDLLVVPPSENGIVAG